MKVLIIGSGGREHALAWKIKQSPKVKELYCAPGNGGISQIAECIDIKTNDVAGLLGFALKNKIDLTVVGPEDPLVLGVVDEFERHGLKIFGPSQAAARLEGSKIFAKQFMQRQHIPTADFEIFDDSSTAMNFVEGLKGSDFPVVIKADGLAAGKGVFIVQSLPEAKRAIEDLMEKKIFKEAGQRILIEECLSGQEVSILAVSDGQDFLVFDSAQDHKRIFDDDLGPNTGGMGAYSPSPFVTQELAQTIEARIIYPAVRGMRQEGIPFRGVLYAGIMITPQGPYVLEFNVRLGDPETQAVIPRLKNDLVDVMLASCQGRLNGIKLNWDRQSCVCVVMSSGGYPGVYETGKEISGLTSPIDESQFIIFHAGTKKEEGSFWTSGGRVLGVTGLGKNIEEAIGRAYAQAEKIKFERCFFRRDIGARAVKRVKV